ncbi:MAG TPA: hypothetical protein VKG45_08715 [Actinomycetes bacterium]|nr:hypothetical protein [Actinomycetes bacterium]
MTVAWIVLGLLLGLLLGVIVGYPIGVRRGSRWVKAADGVADILRELVWGEPNRKRLRHARVRASDALRQYEEVSSG